MATPDPRNESLLRHRDLILYGSMSTIALIDAPPSAPLLITYLPELDLLQMQVQACELFARLVTDHGCKPRLRVIRGHNHTTQTYAVNTGDESLSAPVLEFLRAAAAVRSRPALGEYLEELFGRAVQALRRAVGLDQIDIGVMNEHALVDIPG